jgi:hypothetical protein
MTSCNASAAIWYDFFRIAVRLSRQGACSVLSGVGAGIMCSKFSLSGAVLLLIAFSAFPNSEAKEAIDIEIVPLY